MELHKALKRQIAKNLPPNILEMPEMAPFLNTVSDYYYAFEKDIKIADHAFQISEKEYQDAMQRLQEQFDIKKKSLHQLRNAINTFKPDLNDQHTGEENDIIHLIGFLQEQIIKAKELENTLIQAKESAEQATRAKSEFLSVMSHEIRTPLNAIIGYIHLLIEEEPLERQQEYLSILQVSGQNLLSLINDILDFNKIEEGKIVFAESDFDIRGLINNIKLSNKIRAEENGNMLKAMIDEDIPRFLKGDTTRLTQVLNNLISNAIKFTRKGKITLELQLTGQKGDFYEIEFSVSDTGIGISREHQDKIFERFTQAHAYITREYGGSGLGLAIIKRLLSLQKSEIQLESEAGKGSRFFFRLSFPKSEHKAIDFDQLKLDAPVLNGVKILLVEDVSFNAILAKKMLTKWNAEVDLAENGQIAVEKVKANHYDLVLMDVQMPVMDGLTASSEIRKFNSDINIIALTASTSPEMQEQFKIFGVDEFIFKPINPETMQKTLNKHFPHK